ncbi:MAG: hypothetical protein QXR84_01930 [Candidatus Bathyarchaeia archaeon]
MNRDFEEALANIETFCRILADKISGLNRSYEKPEPIEKLLRKKVVVEVYKENVEGMEPLVDLFEDEKEIKILALMQPLLDNEITFDTNANSTEIMIGKCIKIKIPDKNIDASKIHVNNNNMALEITIDKISFSYHMPQIKIIDN